MPGSSANIVSQSFTETEFFERRCDAASAMRYNELAQILNTADPASPSGAAYQQEQLHIIDYNDYNVSTLEDGIFASREWLTRPGNRDIAVRFLRGALKGWLYARDFPVETNRHIFSSNVHQHWMNNEVSKLIFPHWEDGFGVAPKDALQASADRAFRYGALRRPASVEDFYDDTIAIEAQAGYDGTPADATESIGSATGTVSSERNSNWAADRAKGILGSADFRGMDYVAPHMRFCRQSGQLSICIGERHQAQSDYLATDSGVGIALQALAAAALLCVLVVTLFLIGFRHQRNIIASSLPFCLIISLGAALFISSVFLSTGVAETARCHARVWLMCTGFVLMMGSFVIKVRRIDAIFNNRILAAVKLTNDVLYKQVAALLAVELVLLALFSGLSGYEVRVFNDLEDGNLFHTQCLLSSPDGGGSNGAGAALTALLFAFKGAILCYGIFLAYATRDVTSAYNESKFLAMSTYNLVFISLIVVPIVAFMELEVGAQLIVANIGIIVAVTFSFMMLFAPKIWQAYEGTLSFSAPSMGTTAEPRHGQQQQHHQRQGGAGAAGGANSPHASAFKAGAERYPASPQLQRGRSGGTLAQQQAQAQQQQGGASPPLAGGDPVAVADAQRRWAMGLKQLSRESLLSQLHMFRLQKAVVRAELASRGLSHAQVDEALDRADAGLGLGVGLRPLPPHVAVEAICGGSGNTTTALIGTATGSTATMPIAGSAGSAGSRGTTGGRPSVSSAAASQSLCTARCSPPPPPAMVGMGGRGPRNAHGQSDTSGVSLTPGLLTLAQLTQLRTRAPPQPAQAPSHFGGESLMSGGWGPEWSSTPTSGGNGPALLPTFSRGPSGVGAGAGAGAGVAAPAALSPRDVQLELQSLRAVSPQGAASGSVSPVAGSGAGAAAAAPQAHSQPSTPVVRSRIRLHIGDVHPMLAAVARPLQMQMHHSAAPTPTLSIAAAPDCNEAAASAAPSSSASPLL